MRTKDSTNRNVGIKSVKVTPVADEIMAALSAKYGVHKQVIMQKGLEMLRRSIDAKGVAVMFDDSTGAKR